jgi:hypothetical protein
VWHDSRTAVIVMTLNTQLSLISGSPHSGNQFMLLVLSFLSDMVSGLGGAVFFLGSIKEIQKLIFIVIK